MDLILFNGGVWLVWLTYWIIIGQFVKPTKSAESLAERFMHLGPAAVGFYLVFHDRHWGHIYGPLHFAEPVRWCGTILTVVGLLFATWARAYLGRNWSGVITLKEGHELVRNGPYRFVRHPLYTGFLLAVFGSALVAATGDALVGFAVITIAYLVKLRREEAILTAEFGDQYRQFQREVPALLPFLC
jgi:protein-S-isoprenylcysteine O-methyltransferase Ste14